MRTLNQLVATVLLLSLVAGSPVIAQQQMKDMPNTKNRPMHDESAHQHRGAPESLPDDPPLPDGMSLDDVLDYAAHEAPADFPEPIEDDHLRWFVMFEQLEYRIGDDATDHLGWDAEGYIGFDYDKFWWKSEGEAVFHGMDEGESENDFLYSKLLTPFWSGQIGVQYANEWTTDDYEERWSGVVALQGTAPGMFEIDASLYVSEDADVTAAIEAEYDIRLTQRLVLQPRAELSFAAQDIPDRMLGAGMTDAKFDLRLWYEIKREFAPYIGVRYQTFIGETADIMDDAGRDREEVYFLVGVRLAF